MSKQKEIGIIYGDDVSESVRSQGQVFLEALKIYQDRNEEYRDNWRRYGWRGCLYDLRRKVERAWDRLWSIKPGDNDSWERPDDDLLDVINYAAITARAIQEGNRDGEGGWW